MRSLFESKGFITGCDSQYEWMLPWCIQNIRKHMPKVPIAVADFGMSEKSLKRLKKELKVKEILTGFWKTNRKSWFLKPEALLRSPFKKTFWIDVDCEMVSPCPEIFDYAVPHKLALTFDPWAKRTKRAYWATGVVGIDGKPPILEKWVKKCQEKRGRGDQEILYSMIGSSEDSVNRMPAEYQWLRLDLTHGIDSDSKKLIHWTGPRGKDHIKKLITQSSS